MAGFDSSMLPNYSELTKSIEDTLRGKTVRTSADGKQTVTNSMLISENSINSIMISVRAVVSQNTFFSYLTPYFVQEKAHAINDAVFLVLTEEEYEGRISAGQRSVILEGIDSVVMATLKSALLGDGRNKLLDASRMNFTFGQGQSGMQPTR
jgi:hypothetical protein